MAMIKIETGNYRPVYTHARYCLVVINAESCRSKVLTTCIDFITIHFPVLGDKRPVLLRAGR